MIFFKTIYLTTSLLLPHSPPTTSILKYLSPNRQPDRLQENPIFFSVFSSQVPANQPANQPASYSPKKKELPLACNSSHLLLFFLPPSSLALPFLTNQKKKPLEENPLIHLTCILDTLSIL